MTETDPTDKWLEWAREIQAIAQIGDTYAENEWQKDRYFRLMEIAAEIVNKHSNLPVLKVNKDFRLQRGYATPKVDVRGAIFKDNKLLMVEEVSDGSFTMPGGWADVGDLPSVSAEREVFEESGFQVKSQRLIGLYDANRLKPLTFYHAYKIVFLCKIIGGEARTSKETVSVGFYSEEEIPSSALGERTGLRQIGDAFAVMRDPTLPVFFD